MKFKRYLSFLLIVCMLFGTVISVFSAPNFTDDANRDYDAGLEDGDVIGGTNDGREVQQQYRPEDDIYFPEDIEVKTFKEIKPQYERVSEKLQALGVWERPDGEYFVKVTRGDFASIIARFVNVKALAVKQTFTDVTPEHKNYNDIEALRDMKIINDADDGLFRPDDEILYYEALTILIRTLGYEPYVKNYGEYPTNYLAVAAEKKLISTIKVENLDSTIDRNDAVNLIYNSLEAEIFNQELYGANQVYRDAENALYYFHKIIKTRGIATAAGETYLDGEEPTAPKTGKIAGILFEDQTFDFLSILGRKKDVYYKIKENGSPELVMIDEPANYNTVLRIDYREIAGADGNTISFYPRDNAENRRTVSVNKDSKAIINYFEPSEYDEDDIKNADSITLIDNNNDGSFDVLMIFKTEVHFILGVNERDNKVYDYHTKNAVEIDFDSPDVLLVDRYGGQVDTYYMTNNSVISIGYNKDATKRRIIISNRSSTGIVSEIEEAGRNKNGKITVMDKLETVDVVDENGEETGAKELKPLNERSYYFSSNYSLFTGDNALNLDKKYTFYFDYRGNIAGFIQTISTEYSYGYLVKAVKENSLAENAKLMIYTYVSGMEIFKTAPNVLIDGTSYRGGKRLMVELERATEAMDNKLAALDEEYAKNRPASYYRSGALYVRQPILYRTNLKGEVMEIDTPYCGVTEDIGYRDSLLGRKTLTLYDNFITRNSSYTPGGTFLRNTMAFNSDSDHVVGIKNDLKLFLVPISNDFDVLDDERNYERVQFGYFKDWTKYPGDSPVNDQDGTATAGTTTVRARLEAYNVDKDRTAPLMVYYRQVSSSKPLDAKTPLTVVTKTTQSIVDSEHVTYLYGYQGNAEVKVRIASNVSLTKQFRGPDDSVVDSTVKRGDIIRYETNYKGELSNYVKVFSISDEDDPDIVKSGNEVGTSGDTSGLKKTLLAVSDGKYKDNGHTTAHIYGEKDSGVHKDSFRLVYKSVLYRNGNNLVLNFPYGLTGTDELGDKGEIANATPFNIICIDEIMDRIYVPDPSEIIASFNSSEEDATKVILHTGGSSQKQLIIVRRKK